MNLRVGDLSVVWKTSTGLSGFPVANGVFVRAGVGNSGLASDRIVLRRCGVGMCSVFYLVAGYTRHYLVLKRADFS